MTDEQIIGALRQADDLAITEEVDCYDLLRYITRLKDEIAGLTGALEAAETDKNNLLHTLEEGNEEYRELKDENERLSVALRLAQARATDAEEAVQCVQKETAKEILGQLKQACPQGYVGFCVWIDITAKEYGVEVEE